MNASGMSQKAKKAKKIAKAAKKAKTIAPKSKKPAKASAKPAVKSAGKPASKAKSPAAKLVKKVAKKLVEKLLPKKKLAAPPKAKKAIKEEPKKEAAKKDAPKDNLKAALKDIGPKEAAKGEPSSVTVKVKKIASPKTLQAKGSVVEVVPAVVDVKNESKTVKDIILTDAEGRILCRVKDCDQPSVVESYCRYHYLFYWKKIQNRKKILSEGKLEQYIEELTSRYPLKFLELIRKDLSSEPDFMSAIQELDIDEASTDVDSFEDENFMEEVRGISSVDTERVDDEY